MTVPGRVDAAGLLLSLDPPPWFVHHARAVAEVASWLAATAGRRGARTDRTLVEAAALLHDVDKLPAAHVKGVRHGEGSAAWLEARGLGDLAPLVRDHPVTHLAEDEGAARLAAAPLAARVVAYADKRAGQRLEPMERRFASWRRRYPPGSGVVVRRTGGAAWDEATFARTEDRARALEREVCAAAGIEPAGVSRLRWSRRALREATR
jgi:hypothetical protein